MSWINQDVLISGCPHLEVPLLLYNFTKSSLTSLWKIKGIWQPTSQLSHCPLTPTTSSDPADTVQGGGVGPNQDRLIRTGWSGQADQDTRESTISESGHSNPFPRVASSRDSLNHTEWNLSMMDTWGPHKTALNKEVSLLQRSNYTAMYSLGSLIQRFP